MPPPLQPNEWHAWLLKANGKQYQPTLLELLTGYIGQPPQFAKTHRQKPYLANSPLQFNVSHSGDFTLIAVTTLSTIGADIEQIKPFPDMKDVADRYFTASERKHQDFFTTWTRKEAYIKATGEGLYMPLDQIDVTDNPPGYAIRNLPVPQGYAAAVAVPHSHHTYQLFSL